MSAIAGVFSDFKLVKTRSCAQLVIEVPIERADEALKALGGLPQPSAERWVGIAPLKNEPSQQADPFETPAAEEDGSRRPFKDLLPSQQAGIKCSDPAFQQFLAAIDDHQASNIVRGLCGVRSRAELNTDPIAAAKWQKLLRSFEDHRLGRH